MNDIIKFLGLIPIIIYYLLESFLYAIFTNFTWKFFLFDLFKIDRLERNLTRLCEC